MVAFVCYPEPWNVIDGAAMAANPIDRMGWDDRGLVYRSTTVTTYFTVQSFCPTPIDVIALVGTNLRNRDMVRVRVGSSQTEVDGVAPIDITMTAWSGLKADAMLAKTIVRLPEPVLGKFVRIDIDANSHPDGFVQIERLVIGSSAHQIVINQNAEVGINDGSVSYDTAGTTYWDKYAKSQTFKATFSYLKEKAFRQKWLPMLAKAGNSSAVLFVPNYDLKSNVNLLRDSQTFHASWSNTAGGSWLRLSDYAHDGTMTGAIISDNVTDSASYFAQSVTIPADVVTYTGSVFVKKATAPTPMVRMMIEVTGVAAANTFVQLNPRTGESNYPAGVTDAGDYWRVSRPLANTTGNTIVRIRLYPAINVPDSSLTAAINEVVGSNTFSGAQIHIGSEPLEWTPSSFSAVTDKNYAAMEQNDAIFGYITKATPKYVTHDYWSVELQLTSTSL
jgi:hypothetical protein